MSSKLFISFVFVFLLVSCSHDLYRSKSYRVSQNPGGYDFDGDADFVKKYSKYEKIRHKALLKSKRRHGDVDTRINRAIRPHNVEYSPDTKQVAYGVLDEQNAMVTSEGVDIASMFGAKYINHHGDESRVVTKSTRKRIAQNKTQTKGSKVVKQNSKDKITSYESRSGVFSSKNKKVSVSGFSDSDF